MSRKMIFDASAALVAIAMLIFVAGCTEAFGEEVGDVYDRIVTDDNVSFNGCSGRDCIIYDLGTQARCTEMVPPATYDSRWKQGLDTNVDQTVEGGEIAAYQIQWFNGSWSGWFVPGVNDIDIKYNTHDSTMRRMWAYFYDHTHKYILCR